MARRGVLVLFAALSATVGPAPAGERVLDARLHHLRVAGPREWGDFPETPEGPKLAVTFRAQRNSAEWTLRPGVSSERRSRHTSRANVVRAGAWTQTGWPATMESAVRSGRAAARLLSNMTTKVAA